MQLATDKCVFSRDYPLQTGHVVSIGFLGLDGRLPHSKRAITPISKERSPNRLNVPSQEPGRLPPASPGQGTEFVQQ